MQDTVADSVEDEEDEDYMPTTVGIKRFKRQAAEDSDSQSKKQKTHEKK